LTGQNCSVIVQYACTLTHIFIKRW